jgi:ribosome-binding protein aMBF1 (putative translation factor)
MRTKLQKISTTTDAVRILDRITGNDPAMHQLLEEARLNAKVAQQLYSLRTKAGLSQSELAKRVGTTQSVISRLEDADYEGHSLPMLQRIASAMDKQLEVRFVQARRKPQFV